MKTTELVLDFLRKQGFCPEIDPDNGNLFFKFEMTNFLYINNDEDSEFFQLIMPAIAECTEDNRDLMLEAANKVNQSIKVVKVSILENSVWLFFEILLDTTPNIEDILPRALSALQSARQSFYENIR